MKALTLKFNHWIPKLFRASATTIGHTIYYADTKDVAAKWPSLFKHEVIHVQQVERSGGLFTFLWLYFFQWIRAGFKYKDIAFEVEAYRRQNEPFTQEEEAEWVRWFS